MTAPYRLDQLDEELRVALGLAQRPGLVWGGEPLPRFTDTAAWMALTVAQRAAFKTACDAHVADANWGEKQDIRVCRLFLQLTPGTATAVQRDQAIQALIRIVRGLAT